MNTKPTASFEDRPGFLFDEFRQPVLPGGSEAAEMNSLKAMVIVGHRRYRPASIELAPKRGSHRYCRDRVGPAVLWH
jgi:hypothetical protein